MLFLGFFNRACHHGTAARCGRSTIMGHLRAYHSFSTTLVHRNTWAEVTMCMIVDVLIIFIFFVLEPSSSSFVNDEIYFGMFGVACPLSKILVSNNWHWGFARLSKLSSLFIRQLSYRFSTETEAKLVLMWLIDIRRVNSCVWPFIDPISSVLATSPLKGIFIDQMRHENSLSLMG